MNRKYFLKNLLGTAGALYSGHIMASDASEPALVRLVQQPPFLKPGDTIGITCPASPVELKEMLNCQNFLRNWGFKICVGNTVGQHWERFGGNDAERAADLQLMLSDPSIKAILFAKGGYGAMRMMDRVDWSVLTKNPKWLVGYSDITAIHCHIQTTLAIPTLHADMATGFGAEADQSTNSLREILTGQRINYVSPQFPLNRKGEATGILVGGNLSLVTAMMGSKSELNTEGKILFLEEVSEYKYTLDRMLMTLQRSGKFDKLAGLIIGGITATKADTETNFPMSVEEIIKEKVKSFNYPVCFNFPAGHIKKNTALKLGLPYRFLVTEFGSSLAEIRENPTPSAPVISQDPQQ